MKNIPLLSAFIVAACCQAAFSQAAVPAFRLRVGTQLNLLRPETVDLYKDQAALIARVDKVETTLQTASDRLGVLSTLEADLKALEVAVNSSYAAAEAAETIPQAREKAGRIKKSLGTLKVSVTNARQRLSAITAKTEPIRKKLAAVATAARELKTGLTGINEGIVAQMPAAGDYTAGCLPAVTLNCALQKISGTTGQTLSLVKAYDKQVERLLATPEGLLPELNIFDPFSANLSAIDDLRKEIAKLSKSLEPLTRALAGVNNVLNMSFGFSFPYPDPTPTDPLRTSNYSVNVSFRTIVKGVGAIEDEIEDKLSSFLWGVLKGLGVDSYVKSLQNQANAAVDKALEAVNLNLKLDLPDLGALDAFENAEKLLSTKLDGITFPAIDAKLTSFGLPGIPDSLDLTRLAAALKFYNPGTCSAFDKTCN